VNIIFYTCEGVGKCVGGAAQRTEESLRNATVVADDIVHLLHLSQQVYDQTLKVIA